MIQVRVQPRARRDEVVGERDGAIVVRLVVPPVEGRANEALRRLIARHAGVRRSAVEIVRGHAGRSKLVRAAGLDDAELRAALLAGQQWKSTCSRSRTRPGSSR